MYLHYRHDRHRGPFGSVSRSVALVSAMCVCLAWPCVANGDEPVGPVLQVTLDDGSKVSTRFVGPERAFARRPAGEESRDEVAHSRHAITSLRTLRSEMSRIRQIDFPRQTYKAAPGRPARIVTLWTGEKFVSSRVDFPVQSTSEFLPVMGVPGQPGGTLHTNPDDWQGVSVDRFVGIESIRPPRHACDYESTPYSILVPDADGKPVLRHLRPQLAWMYEPKAETSFWPLKAGGSATFTLPRPAAGVVATVPVDLDEHTDLPFARDEQFLRIRFLLLDGKQEREVTVHIDARHRGRLECSLISAKTMTRKHLSVEGRSARVQLILDDSLTVSVNGRLLGSSARWKGSLSAVRVEASRYVTWFGMNLATARFRVRRDPMTTPLLHGRLTPVHDAACLLLTSGDEVFGQYASRALGYVRKPSGVPRYEEPIDWGQEGHEIVRIATANGPVYVPWPDIAAVRFGHRPSAIGVDSLVFSSDPELKWIARIKLAPEVSCARFGEVDGGWLRARIDGVTPWGLAVTHPLLGICRLPWKTLRRIEPLAFGDMRMLDAGPRHLGNGIREDFSAQQPVGTELSLEWRYPDRSSRPGSLNSELKDGLSVFLTLDAAELIPSGPGTLSASPFLKTVREGFLATRVEVNGKRIGTLNEQVSIHCPAHAPRRIRMRIPRAVLRTGVNKLRFRQTPAPDDATSFDDCEIRSIAIEKGFPMPLGAR